MWCPLTKLSLLRTLDATKASHLIANPKKCPLSKGSVTVTFAQICDCEQSNSYYLPKNSVFFVFTTISPPQLSCLDPCLLNVYVASVSLADRQGGQLEVVVACPVGHCHEFILWHYHTTILPLRTSIPYNHTTLLCGITERTQTIAHNG